MNLIPLRSIDHWLIRQIVRLFARRYGHTIRREMYALSQVAERYYFEQVKKDMATCGENVVLRTGVRIFYPENVRFGNHIVLNYGCIIMGQGGIEIGDFCVLAPQALLVTVSHPTDGIYYGRVYHGPVKLGENVWIGAGAIVLPGVEIGSNSIVGAGAVVTKNIPADSIALGIPAIVTGNTPYDPENLAQQRANIRSKQWQPLILDKKPDA